MDGISNFSSFLIELKKRRILSNEKEKEINEMKRETISFLSEECQGFLKANISANSSFKSMYEPSSDRRKQHRHPPSGSDVSQTHSKPSPPPLKPCIGRLTPLNNSIICGNHRQSWKLTLSAEGSERINARFWSGSGPLFVSKITPRPSSLLVREESRKSTDKVLEKLYIVLSILASPCTTILVHT